MLDSPPWAPSTQQVAARILARTRLPNGEVAGNFTTETKPTAAQVQEVITQAVSLMRPRLGEVADRMVDQAQALVALRCAFMVELGFFPEQVETAVSPYNALRMEYKDELANWDQSARGLEPNSQVAVHSVRVATEYPGYTIGTL